MLSGLKACNFIKKRLQHKCFPANIANFFRTSFFIEHLWRLLEIQQLMITKTIRRVKRDRRKNNLLRCRGWLSLLNWIGALTLSLLLKLPPKKLEPYSFYEVSFSWGSSEISIIPYGHVWNTVAMSRLVLLVATWDC